MKTVALISGGKDSCFNMMQCVAEGHKIVALANLKPKNKDELDSYMYQSVGHHAIDLYAEAMDLPLYRREIDGTSKSIGKNYELTANDEVEDLYELLKLVKEATGIEGVSVGAILSNYQRVRVENVCSRLGLTPLAYLWRRDQAELLDEMIACKVTAILIKVAAMGLKPEQHLGKSLSEMQNYLLKKNAEFDLNVCGEGGEYETFTVDCPLFKKKIVIDETEMVIHSDDAFAPVGYLNLKAAHLADKHIDTSLPQSELVKDLPMKYSSSLMEELFSETESIRCTNCEELQRKPAGNITEVLKPCLYLRGPHLWISNVTTMLEEGVHIKSLTSQTMDQLRALVTGCGPGWDMSCLCLVHLYVKNMEDFTDINSVYKTYFGINPAARVCVEADLPDNVAMQIDCYGYCHHDNRDTMHVQGLSHWAPANIGPYSQAVMIEDNVYVAGQIGMIPANLSLIEGGIHPQARLSLRHTDRVIQAMNVGSSINNVRVCVCYVTHHDYIEVARDEFCCTENTSISSSPVCVVVPKLPKGALIEWQFVANKHKVTYKEHRVIKSVGNLECALKCFHGNDDEDHTGKTFSSITGSLYVQPLPEIVNPLAEDVASLFYCCHKAVIDELILDSNLLPNIRIFYPAAMFNFQILCNALASLLKDLPFSLVPVLELETKMMVLSVCQ